jgi:multisubunit Na+/H+ antiporter MnhB subunit
MKKESGFIQIILIVIVFVVVALYFGKNPVTIWENIKPLFERLLDLFVNSIGFLIGLITSAWQNS